MVWARYRTIRSCEANIMKKILIIITLLSISSCTHTPTHTDKIINTINNFGKTNNIKLYFFDDREERFRNNIGFTFSFNFPAYVFSHGDKYFDTPLNIVFEKMMLRRFGYNIKGYKTEIKLKSFYYTWKPHELSALPFIGILVSAADVEYSGVLKAEVAILNKNDKFLFHKIYETVAIKSAPQSDDSAFDVLYGTFQRFSEEFETDIQRINFN